MPIRIRLSVLLLLTLAFSCGAYAQGWPTRPVRMIVPFAPGGTTDITARLIAPKMQQALGQPVIVENRTGAGGTIATEFVVKSAPDGYTLLMAGGGPTFIAPLAPKPRYDSLRDLAMISNVNTNPQVLLVHPSVPAKNVRELIAYAKANPGKLNFGTAGMISLIHLSAEVFNHMAGVNTVLVHYKGGAPATAAAMAGEVQATFANPSDAIPQMKSGKLRALAVTGSARLAQMPELPTITSSGLPGFVADTFNGVVAPAGTSPEIIARLSRIIQEIVKEPAISQRMLELGTTPVGDTPEQFRAYLQAQVNFWSKSLRASGIKLNEF
ncbi:MAG: tripartite tricarboxylate transporter substrate binding protein [Betaproteobacteria bacterium]|nr:tripartite tricarboxylate transporter substrate binding protein [Betaproteobacteria bacterium]